MQSKELVGTYGANPAKALRCAASSKLWFGSGRSVILDSGFASLKSTKGMAENRLFMIGNGKTAHVGFPKVWLLKNSLVRG